MAPEGLGNYSSGLALHLSRLLEHMAQCLHIAAIHHESTPSVNREVGQVRRRRGDGAERRCHKTGQLPKGFTALLKEVYTVLEGLGAAVAQVIHVKDGHEIVQTVVGSKGHGLPDGAFRGLAISNEAEHPVAGASQETLGPCLGLLWAAQANIFHGEKQRRRLKQLLQT